MPRLKNRRGATAVVVIILLIPLLGFAALVLDAGRWQVGATELQTAADAAALAAARTLQVRPSTAGADAPPMANTVASQNRAFGADATVLPADVRPKYWDPATKTAVDRGWAATKPAPNAVEVRTRRNGGFIFGGVFGGTPPTVERRATAWIANINGGQCVVPMALDYAALHRVAHGALDPTLPDLTQIDLERLNGLPESARRVAIAAAKNNLAPTLTDNYQWTAYNFTGNAGKPGYIAAINSCAAFQVVVGEAGVQQNSVQVHNWTSEEMGPICNFKSATDARCYASAAATVPGVEKKVSWIVPANGQQSLFRVVGKFVITCYYRGAAGPGSGPAATCPVAPTGKPTSGYPEGTIIGVVQGITPGVIGPNDVLGNVVGDVQRLILVQ
jgi:hypothetical protein